MIKCPVCEDENCLSIWIQIFRSFDQAASSGQVPDWLGALAPGPAPIKMTMCFSCGAFRPSGDLTEEEIKEMKEYGVKQNERGELGEQMAKLFGFVKEDK